MQDSLWFVPTVLVLLAAVVATVLLQVDIHLVSGTGNSGAILFAGTSDSAQTLLAVIAGTLVTAISIAYSMTIVALQLASTQFSPRVLRTSFTGDRGNQFVLGMYLATFTYCLLVIREIRSTAGNSGDIVPTISVFMALIFALICLALLVYFIHHIAQLLQVSVVIERVHADIIAEFDRQYPAQLPAQQRDELPVATVVADLCGDEPSGIIRATSAGFLRTLDISGLIAGGAERCRWIWVRAMVGEYVPYGSVLVEYAAPDALTETQQETMRQTFALDAERTMFQDPLFGFRQLVDIALKALSPAVNDPTTAEYCLAHLGDALGRLSTRTFPPYHWAIGTKPTWIVISTPPWDDFVDLAFSQIRRQAVADVHVTGYLLATLAKLVSVMPAGQRITAVRHQIDGIRSTLDTPQFGESDALLLHRQCDQIEIQFNEMQELVRPDPAKY